MACLLKILALSTLLGFSLYDLHTLSWASLLRLSLVYGYLLGSFPTGYIFVQIFKKADIRTLGSQSTGATNVLRTGHKYLAAITLIGDTLKGYFAAHYLPYLILCIIPQGIPYGIPPDSLVFVAGAAVLLGHCYPFWLNFKGGKGIATGLGIFLGLSPILALIATIVWIVTAFLFRYSSLASLLATYVVLGFSALTAYFPLTLFIAGFITFQHRGNLYRLSQHTEPKIGRTSS